jgi:hypothetical protein
MKKFLVSLALASTALVASAPASAQYRERDRYDERRYDERRYDDRGDRGDRFGRGEYRGQDLRPRLDRIQMQISRGLERGNITQREAQSLRYEANSIWAQARNFYRTGGYDYREQAVLDQRIDRLQERVRYERRDDDRRSWR